MRYQLANNTYRSLPLCERIKMNIQLLSVNMNVSKNNWNPNERKKILQLPALTSSTPFILTLPRPLTPHISSPPPHHMASLREGNSMDSKY